jgi:hypothetical protein
MSPGIQPERSAAASSEAPPPVGLDGEDRAGHGDRDGDERQDDRVDRDGHDAARSASAAHSEQRSTALRVDFHRAS